MTKPYTIIRRFLFEHVGMISIYYLSCLSYTEIYIKLRKYCNFGTKDSRRTWHVIPAQEVKDSEVLKRKEEKEFRF